MLTNGNGEGNRVNSEVGLSHHRPIGVRSCDCLYKFSKLLSVQVSQASCLPMMAVIVSAETMKTGTESWSTPPVFLLSISSVGSSSWPPGILEKVSQSTRSFPCKGQQTRSPPGLGIVGPELMGMHCKEDPIYVFPEMKLRGLVPNVHIHVSISDLCMKSVHLFCCSKLCIPDHGNK
jgi:hypothetical protein